MKMIVDGSETTPVRDKPTYQNKQLMSIFP